MELGGCGRVAQQGLELKGLVGKSRRDGRAECLPWAVMDTGPFTEIETRGKGVELGKLVESSQCKAPGGHPSRAV